MQSIRQNEYRWFRLRWRHRVLYGIINMNSLSCYDIWISLKNVGDAFIVFEDKKNLFRIRFLFLMRCYLIWALISSSSYKLFFFILIFRINLFDIWNWDEKEQHTLQDRKKENESHIPLSIISHRISVPKNSDVATSCFSK